MAEKRNFTVQLDADTIRKARIVAAERETSVSKLVAEQIKQLVSDADDYRVTAAMAIAELKKGYHLGGGPLPRREELYDR